MPNVQTLPETSNRRALLRLIVGDAGRAAPTASTEPSAKADGQDNLRNIGLRLLDLEDERSRIAAEYKAARDRMNEVAPLPPKPRPRKIEEGKPKPLFSKPLKKIVRVPGASGEDKFLEDTPADAYWRLLDGSDVKVMEMMRKEVYQISSRYLGKLVSAAVESGYMGAVRRLEDVNGQIRQTAAEAFEIETRTSRDVAIQGYALLEAFAAEDGRAHDKFAKTLARNAIAILPLEGGGSRVTPTVRTVAEEAA
jgi:hypothetical protein